MTQCSVKKRTQWQLYLYLSWEKRDAI